MGTHRDAERNLMAQLQVYHERSLKGYTYMFEAKFFKALIDYILRLEKELAIARRVIGIDHVEPAKKARTV